jgi:acyl-coenzyme A synthetase/AMP-(fatty) acid ligase
VQLHSELVLLENEDWADDSEGLNNASPKIYLQTSGSTGSPKMAAHLHTKLMGNAFNCVERLGLTSEDRIAIPVPIFHMYYHFFKDVIDLCKK